MRMRSVLLYMCLLSTIHLTAQVNPDTSRLTGIVLDQLGTALPETTITLLNEITMREYVTASGPDGAFHLDFIPPGLYTLKGEKEDFQPFEIQVELTLGRELPVRIIMVAEGWSDEITVTTSVPALAITGSDSVTHIPSQVVESLPLNGRDYSDLVTLVPQVVSDPDERIHISGGRGIFTTYRLDGVDNNNSFFGEERGGLLPAYTVSQTAVAEFQVSQVPFSAQYGGAAGGVVNVITRSGASTYHGDLFGFYRDDSFIEEDANGRDAAEFDQKQYGFTLGGPVAGNWYFFLSTDLQDYGYPTYREWYDPEEDLEDPENLAYLEQFVDVGAETGTHTQTNDQKSYLVRLDGEITPRHTLTGRVNVSDQKGENLTDTYTTTGWSNNGSEENQFWSAALHLTSVLTDSLANEFLVHYSSEERSSHANLTGVPEVTIGNWDAVFGQKNYLPKSVDDDILEINDNLTWFHGKHTFRAGVQASWYNYGDWFYRYQAGSYWFASWEDFFDNHPGAYTQAFSDVNGDVDFSSRYAGAYVQDTFKISRLSITGGIRYENQSFSDPDQSNPDLPESRRAPSTTDLSPRLSFSWDIDGSGNRVLRGGWGRFIGTSPALLLANAYLFNGSTVSTYSLSEGDPSMPGFPDILSDPADLAANTPDVYFFDNNFEQPRVDRTLLEYEQILGHGWSASIGGQVAEYGNLERKQDVNLNILESDPLQFSTQDRPNPDFNRMICFKSDAWGRYLAGTVQIRYRSDTLYWHAHYTRSRSEDNDSNERSVSTGAYFPENQYDLGANWGLGDSDIPDRFVTYAVWTFFPRWTLSGQIIYQSGRPYTAMSDTDDNGDGYRTDRATYDGRHFGRNTFRQPDFRTLDLRLSHRLPLGPGNLFLMVDVFNLFDSSNRTTDRLTYTSTADDGTKVLREDFGDLRIAGQPRQYQVGIRYSF